MKIATVSSAELHTDPWNPDRFIPGGKEPTMENHYPGEHCSACGESGPEIDEDGYTDCCNKRSCGGEGRYEDMGGKCCMARCREAQND